MTNRFLRWLLVIIIINVFALMAGAQPGLVSKGKLNLSEWATTSNPVISLDGEWAFFYNELLQYSEIQKREAAVFALFSVPWNEQTIAGKNFPAKGCATYYAELYLPSLPDSLALEVPAVYNSYALWVNHELICTNGKVAAQKESMIPNWRPLTVSFKPTHDTLHIIFQMANFQSNRGGSIIPMRLGLSSVLKGIRKMQEISAEFMVVSLFIISTFCIAIFLFTGRKPALYFSLFSLFFCVRALFSDLYLYHDYMSNIAWHLAVRIEYATIPALAVTSILFVTSIYPHEVKKSAKIFLLTANVLLLSSIAMAPISFFSELLVVFQVTGLTVAIYFTYVIARAALNERIGAMLSAAGTVMFALVFIYNILIYLSAFEFNPLITNLGYIIAFLLNTIALVYRDDSTIHNEGILRYADLYEDSRS